MALSYAEMESLLMESFRLYHHPVAVTWLFTDEEVEEFRVQTPHVVPARPLTFCQWEIAARMENQTVLGTPKTLGCSGAKISFGWKEIDEQEIKTQLKYCVDYEQAERFVRSKPRMPMNALKAVAVGPLGKAKIKPHVVHFYCDNMQSYHLAVDYMAATNTHPLRPQVSMSSTACGGSVFTWQEQTFNLSPSCSGGYNSGKTERSEVNVFIPGNHIEATVERLRQRIAATGSSAITHAGDAFPGRDICKNCPLIAFKEEGGEACASCSAK